MKSKKITVNAIRKELNKERWDRDRIPVKVRDVDGTLFDVASIGKDRDVFILEIEVGENPDWPVDETL